MTASVATSAGVVVLALEAGPCVGLHAHVRVCVMCACVCACVCRSAARPHHHDVLPRRRQCCLIARDGHVARRSRSAVNPAIRRWGRTAPRGSNMCAAKGASRAMCAAKGASRAAPRGSNMCAAKGASRAAAGTRNACSRELHATCLSRAISPEPLASQISSAIRVISVASLRQRMEAVTTPSHAGASDCIPRSLRYLLARRSQGSQQV